MLNELPEAERKLANSVDPWGLAFADQLARFRSRFSTTNPSEFVLGIVPNLVKVFPNKYWFRDDMFRPLQDGAVTSAESEFKPLWGATGTTVSFQVVVLPRTGAAPASYTIQARAEGDLPTAIWREEYIHVGPARYPRLESEVWPDPLVPENHCDLSGVAAGVFLCEVAIPHDFKGRHLTCNIEVARTGGPTVSVTVPIEVVQLPIRPKEFPLVAWFVKGKLSETQFRGMCEMVLANHLQPLVSAELASRWKPEAPEAFAEPVEFLLQRGQTTFDLAASPTAAVYEFLKQKGWLSRFMAYGNSDEPDEATFVKTCIPYARDLRTKMPGLRVFLATEAHARLAEGTDIILTDLSSSKYDPRTFLCPPGVELWHYYCHLPINWQMRAPLVHAPNMEIDNEALQHRLALWMSWHYGAKGVLIWSGNSEWPFLGEDFWTRLELPAKENGAYPYGGAHHGNGFLVYPPREVNGPVLPSLRLKILRDGLEDIAIFDAIRRKYGKAGAEWVNPVPAVFQHPHYYDQLPETLLAKRTQILEKAREQD